jgi:hypothetical protein
MTDTILRYVCFINFSAVPRQIPNFIKMCYVVSGVQSADGWIEFALHYAFISCKLGVPFVPHLVHTQPYVQDPLMDHNTCISAMINIQSIRRCEISMVLKVIS